MRSGIEPFFEKWHSQDIMKDILKSALSSHVQMTMPSQFQMAVNAFSKCTHFVMAFPGHSETLSTHFEKAKVLLKRHSMSLSIHLEVALTSHLELELALSIHLEVEL